MLKTIEEHRQLGHLAIKSVERAVPVNWPWVDTSTWDRTYLLSICRLSEFRLVGGKADAEIIWHEVGEIDGLSEVLVAAGNSFYTAVTKMGADHWDTLCDRLADGMSVHLGDDTAIDDTSAEEIPDYEKTREVLRLNPWLVVLIMLAQSDYFIVEVA